ncbi:MAG: ATP synthase epsilon chain [Candidatus Uhrbacteria bacterium GW2011_GWA2_53_10]|uniref:ATP synthase epsilon chain n=1 Tax=Candidatus Uhrbacteria bacterium GW2011_GWA2_53_10 TaxID=1618980 RepID=A0A0G1XNR2_9BACT|nr:MAG: ATP synthase epsilon chain [Candidatus Uhrbacteria bacterium GW2011_GWA2_53_10]
MKVEITTPEAKVWSGESHSVSLPAFEGEITVLDNHIPLVTEIVPGTVTIRVGGVEVLLAVTRGIAETDGKSLKLLVQSADRAEKLEEAAIEEAKLRAEKLVSERKHDEEGFAEATALLERELAKLQVVRRRRERRRIS